MTPTQTVPATAEVQAPDHATDTGGSTCGRFAWAAAPVVSVSLLSFLPFLALAIIRQRARDWLVLAAYAWAETVGIIMVVNGGPAGFVILALVMIAAAVHAFIAFGPRPAGAAPGTAAGGGGGVRWPPGGPVPGPVAEELAHLHYVEQFIDQARKEVALGPDAYRVLMARVADRQERLVWILHARPTGAPAPPAQAPTIDVLLRPAGTAAGAGPAAPSAAQAPGAPRVSPALPPQRAPSPWAPPVPLPAAIPAGPGAPPKAPGRARRWWDSTRATVKSDLAVHGLAYLGVLLLFAGLFGLVAFSFSSVRVALRPVAEVAAPAAVFVSAMLLGRRKLVVPARALVVLGGLLLLVSGLAAFADGAAVPPDPAGIALVVALTATPIALGLGYALWTLRRPASALRHLVAPAIWLATAMAALAWVRPIPSGQDIVTPRPGEIAAVIVAIAVTLAVSRSPAGRLLPVTLFPAALAGLGIAGLLEGLAAGVAGWPPAPVAVSGAAAVLAIELSGPRLNTAVRAVLQGIVVALTCLALVPALGVGWAGAVAAVAGLVVVERGMRRAVPAPVLLGLAVVSGAGLAAAAWDTPALLAASAAVTAWAHLRRLWPDGWPYPVLLTVVAAAAPAAVFAGLVRLLPVDLGIALAGLLVLSAGICVRVIGRPADRFWSWWLPAAAAIVLGATVGQTPTTWAAVAAAAAVAVFGVAPVPAVLRVWLASIAILVTAWLAFETAGLPFLVSMLGIAGAAVLAVGAAGFVRGRVAGHIGLAGHLTGLACWPVAAVHAGTLNATAPAAMLGLAVAGVVITTAAAEAGRPAVSDLLVRCGVRMTSGLEPRWQAATTEALRRIPAAVAALLLVPLVAFLPALHVPAPPLPWRPLTISALALAYVVLAHLLRGPAVRVAQVLADLAPWIAVLAAALCDRPDPALAAMATVLVLPALTGPALRRRISSWVAWITTVPFIVLAANLAGLPMRYWSAPALGWGAVLLVGGLAADDLKAGRREPGTGVRVSWLLPPVAVGAAASLAGLGGCAGQPAHYVGWTLIAAAMVAAASGALLHLGPLGGLSAAMATGGLSAVLPWSPLDHPWMLVAAAAIMLGGTEFAHDLADRAAAPHPAWWQRWDAPLFVTAHLAAVAALMLSLTADAAVAVTAVGTGGLALAVSARLRRWPWAIAGTALTLAGSAVAGPGWACLALTGTAVLATALATRNQRWPRTMLQVAGALAAAGAWAAFLLWRDMPAGTAVQTTSLVAGSTVLIAAVATRITAAAAEWARVWGATACTVVLASAAGLADPAVPSDARFFVAASLGAAAVGFGIAAGPLRLAPLRECAAVTAMAAGVIAGLGPGPANLDALTWVALAVGLAASGFVIAPWSRRALPLWLRPALIVAVAAALAALAGGMIALPGRTLLVPAFVLTAVVIVAFAVVLGRKSLTAATPVPLCAAWIAYASEVLGGQSQWYTVPAGVAILAIAGLLRWARRADNRPAATPDVIALEYTGMAMVLAASEVQAITSGPRYALIGLVLGLALAGWGALTRVRRRLLGGTAGFCLSLLLLVVIPLVQAVPKLGGVVVWLTLAGVGVLAILVAALLDATRAAVKRGVQRFSELTKNWE